MRHSEIEQLLGAYALDAVEPEDVAAIEEHLRSCPGCRAEVAEHRETAASLAPVGAEAPPAIWDRIAGSIDRPADVVPMTPRLFGTGDRSRWQRAVTLVAAAAAIVVIGVLGAHVRQQDQRIDRLANEVRVGDRGMTAALADPNAQVVQLAGAPGTELPVVIVGGHAWLQAGALPALPAGRTYQLWGATGDGLVSIAVLGADPGVLRFDVAGFSLLAITAEQAPGVVQSEQEPVVVGELA